MRFDPLTLCHGGRELHGSDASAPSVGRCSTLRLYWSFRRPHGVLNATAHCQRGQGQTGKANRLSHGSLLLRGSHTCRHTAGSSSPPYPMCTCLKGLQSHLPQMLAELRSEACVRIDIERSTATQPALRATYAATHMALVISVLATARTECALAAASPECSQQACAELLPFSCIFCCAQTGLHVSLQLCLCPADEVEEGLQHMPLMSGCTVAPSSLRSPQTPLCAAREDMLCCKPCRGSPVLE